METINRMHSSAAYASSMTSAMRRTTVSSNKSSAQNSVTVAAANTRGISGIENTRQREAATTRGDIDTAFQDLSDLMDKVF